jgi:hypothetical protein
MRLGRIAHNFWGLIGSVAAVLPTTREIFEPTVGPYGAIRRNCQGVNAFLAKLRPSRGCHDSGVDEYDVIHIGRIDFRKGKRPFGIKDEDRFSHLYIIGKTGTGKSTDDGASGFGARA